MKKTISFLLCVILILFSSVSAFAAEIEICATDNLYEYEVLDTITINNNYAKVFATADGIPKYCGIEFIDLATGEEYTIFSPANNGEPVEVYLPSTSGYAAWHIFDSTAGKINPKIEFHNVSGEYEKIRIKLSSYSDEFNGDGTCTYELFGDIHNYNFTDENDEYSSTLMFVSGNAITLAAPDENGYVELYVSKEFPVRTVFSTDFNWKNAYGGGVADELLTGFTVGDVNKQGAITILDATLIQKSIAHVSGPLDKLSSRNADTNGDGKINILDATKIQKYLAKMQ